MRQLLVTLAAGAVAAVVVDGTRRALESGWRRRTGHEPSMNPFDSQGSAAESLLWAIVLTAAVVVVRNVTMKGTSRLLTTSRDRATV